jgi:alpha-glucosidase
MTDAAKPQDDGRGAPWWRCTTVYHLYTRSFADGNGDGIGDLAGVLDRLDYLQRLGVETIWLAPFFRSPQADFGYDITDHTSIDPSQGSLADWERLIAAIHARGMRVVLDMVLNHTSNEHPWFAASRSSRDDPKRDWYIWRDGARPGGKAPPNNWRNMLGGRGWQYEPATDQWYWASFLPFQPDLNWRNPAVKRAMLDVIHYWLDRGADGLRLDIFNALYKDSSFADNPGSFRPLPSEDNPAGFFQRPIHTIDHQDTIAFSRELRTLVNSYRDPERFVVGEVMGSMTRLREYVGPEAEGLHLVFMFAGMRARFTAAGFRGLIREAEAAFPAPLQPAWVFSNHDRPRAIFRLGDDPRKARVLAALQLTVRGVPFIYYGEELGLSHLHIPSRQALDPIAARFRWIPGWLGRWMRHHGMLINRDEVRLPMPWTGGPHAGFTDAPAGPWLPLHPNSAAISVERQDADPGSLLATYRRLLQLRREHPALRAGTLELLPADGLPRSVLGYHRHHAAGTDAAQRATVLLNFADRAVDVALPTGGGLLYTLDRPDPTPAGASHRLGGLDVALVVQDGPR